MELRKCEEQVNELSTLYESLRNESKIQKDLLPQLKGINGETLDFPPDNDSNGTAQNSLAKVVEILHRVQNILRDLKPKIEKFQKRLNEKDPVTGNPRFGEKTQERVTHLLHCYNFVRQYVPDNTDPACESNPLHQLEIQLKKEQEEQKMQIEILETRALQEQLIKEEEERRRKIEEAQLEQQRKEEEARIQQEERERLHQQAQQARQERARQQQQEQNWFNSIEKGAEGVKRYLKRLKQSTGDQPAHVYAKAVESLYRIFQQINAHPEETKFRRIRRDHEQFVEDVGRHDGGVELLIAAGFELGAIDDVPCYLSKEPDIEKDMDGWSNWFDVNKATLEILEEAVQQLK